MKRCNPLERLLIRSIQKHKHGNTYLLKRNARHVGKPERINNLRRSTDLTNKYNTLPYTAGATARSTNVQFSRQFLKISSFIQESSWVPVSLSTHKLVITTFHPILLLSEGWRLLQKFAQRRVGNSTPATKMQLRRKAPARLKWRSGQCNIQVHSGRRRNAHKP